MTNKNSGSKRPYTKKDPQLRFWPKVNKEAPNGCWEWTGSLSTEGYGRFSLNCKGIQAHRYSYELAWGQYPVSWSVTTLAIIVSVLIPSTYRRYCSEIMFEVEGLRLTAPRGIAGLR